MNQQQPLPIRMSNSAEPPRIAIQDLVGIRVLYFLDTSMKHSLSVLHFPELETSETIAFCGLLYSTTVISLFGRENDVYVRFIWMNVCRDTVVESPRDAWFARHPLSLRRHPPWLPHRQLNRHPNQHNELQNTRPEPLVDLPDGPHPQLLVTNKGAVVGEFPV